MSALTIVLVGFTLLVAIVAGLVAWHMRRTQRRNEHQHGYGPPIVVFPRPSSTLITPATRRRAEPRAPEPRVAQPRPAEPPADATHVVDPLAGGARVAEPRSPEVRSPSREPIAAELPAPETMVARGPESDRAAAAIGEVERPRQVEQDRDIPPAISDVPERQIRRRSRDGGRVQREMPEMSDAGRGGSHDMDGALALASPSPSAQSSVRVLAPAGGTLQMLPGRLVIIEGEETGREIRFVRLGANPQRVTFGRNAGRPYEHVQLRAQTVSRLHAQLQYDDGRWYVENLSRTNPLVLNGRAVAAGAPPHPLAEGDVLEMGEVLCRFHER